MNQDSQVNNYLQRIRSGFDEPTDSYRIIDGGWTNLVIEINNRWIFRFVRDINNRQITVERDFLPKFSLVSPIDIPNIFFSASDCIAYHKLEGSRFDPKQFCQLNKTQKTSVIKHLAEFLTTLHNFEFAHPNLSTHPYGGNDFWRDLWLLVSDRLSKSTRDRAERYFINYFERIKNTSIVKTLVHADLGTNNILMNFDLGRLAGIIDFGDLCVGDPAVDFAGFYRNFGSSFVEELLFYYQRPIGANFWERIDFESKRKMFFVIYFASNYGFEGYIPDILEYIETLFKVQPNI